MIVIKGKQADGVEFATYILKLLKDKIWENAMKAVNDDKYAKFSEVCDDAGIPQGSEVTMNIHQVIYAMLRAGLTEYPEPMVWP